MHIMRIDGGIMFTMGIGPMSTSVNTRVSTSVHVTMSTSVNTSIITCDIMGKVVIHGGHPDMWIIVELDRV